MRAGANILNRAYQQPVAAFTLDYDVEISDIMTRFGFKRKKKKKTETNVDKRIMRMREANTS
jgi:hypothetical protein